MKILFSLTLVLALLFSVGANQTKALEGVGFGAGTIVLMEQGKHPELGVLIKARFPWGVNSKDMQQTTQEIVDTTITFEVLTEVYVIHSAFSAAGQPELEGELIINKIRKTLGIWALYGEAGISIWNIHNSGGDNIVRDGYYFGTGALIGSSFKFELGAHLVPVSGASDMYGIQAGLELLF